MDRIFCLRPGEARKVAEHPELLVLMMAWNAVEATRNWLNLLAARADSLAKSDIMLASATQMAWAAEALLRLRDRRSDIVRKLLDTNENLRMLWNQLVGDDPANTAEQRTINKLLAVRDKYVAHWDLNAARSFLVSNMETFECIPLIEEIVVDGRKQYRFTWGQLTLKSHLFGPGLETGSIQDKGPEYQRVVGSLVQLLHGLIEAYLTEIGVHGDWGPAVKSQTL